jgi:hypothetical protein
MRTKDLKSLAETISTVVEPIDDRSRLIAEGYLNSLTEKARQVSENEGKDKNADDIMAKLAAKALKRARKKARRVRPSGDDAYAGINPPAAATDPDMKNKGAVAEEMIYEVAAPGYEDWASDPKVKASFKKQYGKDWKQVMYGRSWNMAKMDEEVELAEGDSAKRMRILRKGKPVKGAVKDFMDRSFKKKFYKNKTRFGGETPAVLGRARLKHSAMKAKGLAEAEQLDEAGYKRLMRIKRAAYKADLASRKMNPKTPKQDIELNRLVNKHGKLGRAAAERTAQVAASFARRGGASDDAVRGGGSLVGKSGKYTQKAATLAAARVKGIANFRLAADRGVARDTGVGSVKAMADRLHNKKPQMTPAQVAKKRKDQAAMRDFRNRERSGDFGQNNQEGMRPRYNYLKRTGQLKTK